MSAISNNILFKNTNLSDDFSRQHQKESEFNWQKKNKKKTKKNVAKQ